MIRRAFTLIELLVVIAIIAILAAILFPVFAQAKQAAKQSSSLSSVKQIMTGVILYNGDNDDTQVPDLWQNRGDGEWTTWMEIVDPYLKNTDIFLNPSSSAQGSAYGCAANLNPKIVSHYIMPLWVPYSYWNWSGTTMFAGFPIENNAITSTGTCKDLPAWASCTGMTKVAEPSNTAVLIPGVFVTYPRAAQKNKFGWPCTTVMSSDHGKPNPVDPKYHPFREGANYGMADSHARYFSSKKMNGNASRPHNYGGFNYPSSPYMVVVE